MNNLLDEILENVSEPIVHSYMKDENNDIQVRPGEAFIHDKFSLAAVTVGYDAYLGRTCTGRVQSGSVSLDDELIVLKAGRNGEGESDLASGNVSGIFINRGVLRTPLGCTAFAGDIVTLAGVPDSVSVGDTLTLASNPVPIPLKTPPVAPPILAMDFGSNDGPLGGLEGTEVTPSKIRNRLISETGKKITFLLFKVFTGSFQLSLIFL